MSSTVCNCPKCNHAGVSVAAMNYRETQQWHKSGDFSGSGIGIGTGGVGVGFGGGSYSETGEIATKRANKFNEPEPFSANLNFVFPILAVIFTINGMPFFIEMMSSMNPNAHGQMNVEGFQNIVSGFNHYVAPVLVAFYFIMLLLKLVKSQEKADKLNATVYRILHFDHQNKHDQQKL